MGKEIIYIWSYKFKIIFYIIGSRDETNETSGSLLSIKNTYLKTVLNTNETVNYGMV